MNKIKTNFEGQTNFISMDIHKVSCSCNPSIQLNEIFIKNVHQSLNPFVRADEKSFRRGKVYKISKSFSFKRKFIELSYDSNLLNSY